MNENYISSLMNWADLLLQNYQDLSVEDDGSDFKRELLQFKHDMNDNATSQSDTILYERANSLYSQFELLTNQNYIVDEYIERVVNEDAVPVGEHTLPPLPYPYNALEPTISREIMQLHHDKHHASYVKGLNKAEKEMKKARERNDYDLIKHWEREAAFHGAGHYLHTIFWTIMSPTGGGKPSGKLLKEINSSFGSYEKFKKHFSESAKNVEAVGWTLLVWSPRSHRLEILQAEKHQNLSQWDVIPLLVLDVWEHAYYLQYKNEREKYVDNWWKLVNWPEVEKRYAEASKLKWQPF